MMVLGGPPSSRFIALTISRAVCWFAMNHRSRHPLMLLKYTFQSGLPVAGCTGSALGKHGTPSFEVGDAGLGFMAGGIPSCRGRA